MQRVEQQVAVLTSMMSWLQTKTVDETLWNAFTRLQKLQWVETKEFYDDDRYRQDVWNCCSELFRTEQIYKQAQVTALQLCKQFVIHGSVNEINGCNKMLLDKFVQAVQ